MYQYPYGNAQQLNLDWILNKLQELESGSGATLEEVANALVSASFDATIPYRKYDYAFYDGKLYCCTANTTGTWDSTKWRETTVGDELSTLMLKVYNLKASEVVNDSSVTGATVKDVLNNLNDNKLTIYSTYYGDTDLDSIVAHSLEIYASDTASLQNKLFTFTALHPAGGQTGYFGNSSVTCICKFSSANYGYGLLLSDSDKFLAAFRRNNAINYLYPIGDFQTEINNLNGAITSNESAIAIVSNNNTHIAITKGQYVFVKNHSTLSGLYIAKLNISADVALTTNNLTAVSNGGFNDLSNTTKISYDTDTGGANKLLSTIHADFEESRYYYTVKNGHLCGDIVLKCLSNHSLNNDSIGTLKSDKIPAVACYYPAYIVSAEWGMSADYAKMGYINTSGQLRLNWGITVTAGQFIHVILNYDIA